MSKTHFPVIPIEQVPGPALEIVSQPSSGTLPPAEPNPSVVLIVDDEHIIADTMSTIFARNGFAVFTAYNAEDALETAHLVPPELLISDVVMPGISGLELAIQIHRTVPDCKIILFSGQAATVDLLHSAKTAGQHFTVLAKPIHPTVMLAHASELLHARDPHRKAAAPVPAPSRIQLVSSCGES